MTADDDVVSRADRLAETWHAGQTRKDSKTPYIVHPRRVEAILRAHWPMLMPVSAAVALLHDVIEDTDCPAETIANECGFDVLRGVWWLTSPDKDGSRLTELPRGDRKQFQREKIAAAPRWVVEVKLADRLDNLRDGVGVFDAEFLAMYREETRWLLRSILSAHPGIERESLWAEIRDAAVEPSS